MGVGMMQQVEQLRATLEGQAVRLTAWRRSRG